ncbi:Uncharacterized protein FKW44_008282, partial [Caligus rogercresseyi]
NVDYLRAIFIFAAARYCALRLRIPKPQDSSWNYAFEVTKFYPSQSARHLHTLKKVLRFYKKKSTPRTMKTARKKLKNNLTF